MTIKSNWYSKERCEEENKTDDLREKSEFCIRLAFKFVV